ncbi:alcohol dehydrogenase like protein [Teratosphaeria destructans]|uniref:Alcohol dehydrogenase like protein n=1 Tax=Teratosphaeria destructans TaxID=418781 RepID=A0A9W7SU80_9PEZI|nr:alcohol dehydrogenase like protein [Teratosphaeria destructans]
MSQQIPETMKAACLVAPGKPLEIKDVPVPEIQDGEILLKVHACGVCHSDHHVHAGDMGPPQIQRLGHEYVGTVVKVSPTEKKWKIGDRVGGAWHGGHDFSCTACGRGQFQMCSNKTINGVMREGGYGEYATLRTEAAVRIPTDADPAEVAPLLCAGVTVFNGMRHMGITPGDVVAIQGLGGLGHLAIQYARKMGFHTVALSRGTQKKDFAMQLGANSYIDTEASNVGEALQKLGGAACVVVTAPNPDVIDPLLGGLAPEGKLLVHVAIGPVQVNTVPLVVNALQVRGWPSGHALDSEEAIRFAQTQGIKCMIEKFPLEKANEALDHMLSGKVRFRGVLTME